MAARWRIVHQRFPRITNLETANLGASDFKNDSELASIYEKVVVYVSDQTHSSGRKGCMIAGVRHLRIIPSDKQYCMATAKLEEQLQVIHTGEKCKTCKKTEK